MIVSLADGAAPATPTKRELPAASPTTAKTQMNALFITPPFQSEPDSRRLVPRPGAGRRAAVAGPLLHAALDVIPHEDIESRRFEINSALVLLTLFAAARVPFDPAVIGAITSSAPDLEHILSLPRPGGRKLFPPHRWSRPHQGGGVPIWVQLIAAGVITGALVVMSIAGRRVLRQHQGASKLPT